MAKFNSNSSENSVDQLAVPFSSWREGLRQLANDLPDGARREILLSRLGATAAQSGIRVREVCALALLVPPYARFEKTAFPQRQPDPQMVGLAAKISDATHEHLANAFAAVERIDDERQKKVFAAFPDSDPRRIFSSFEDTIEHCGGRSVAVSDQPTINFRLAESIERNVRPFAQRGAWVCEACVALVPFDRGTI
jgi:hypothetical protein